MSHHHRHHYDSQSTVRIGWAFFLNVSFTIVEFVGGLLTNSTAIMADAVHDFGDSLSIGCAWLLQRLGERGSNTRFSYGYRRLSLLGALINGLVLIAGSAWVLSEAIPKLSDPQMPVAEGMLVLAIAGVLVNGFAAHKLRAGKTLNERVLNWHLIEDVLGWAAVLIISVILLFVDWPILDPALSIAFTLFIVFNVGKNLWVTIHLFLQAVPDRALSVQLENLLSAFEQVREVHHLHLWSLDGEQHVLTAHLVLHSDFDVAQQASLKQRISKQLRVFELAHTTIELEFAGEQCRDA